MTTGEAVSSGRDAVIPSDWADFYQETKVPAGVWAGNTLRVSSHAGETPDDAFPRIQRSN